MGDHTRFGSEEEKNFEFSPLFGDTGGDEELHDEYVIKMNSGEEIGSAMENEVVGAHVTSNERKTPEQRKSNKMFEGINKILDDIYTEHKQHGKVLKTNIEESQDLRSEIQNLRNGGGPAVISEQMRYLSNSKDLVITKLDKKISLYVNITKDSDDHELIDKDGHRVHIHIPHQVLAEMAETGDDHVIHIDGGLKDKLRYKIEDETKNKSETQNTKNPIKLEEDDTKNATWRGPSEIVQSIDTKNNIEPQEDGIRNNFDTQEMTTDILAKEEETKTNVEMKEDDTKRDFDKDCRFDVFGLCDH